MKEDSSPKALQKDLKEANGLKSTNFGNMVPLSFTSPKDKNFVIRSGASSELLNEESSRNH